MKKLLLATMIGTALATTLPAAAHAATFVVSSDITNMQLWVGQFNLMTEEAPGYFHDLQFGGTATDVDDDGYIDSTNLTFSGLIGFTINALPIQLVVNLSNGNYTQGSGITFSGGYIQPEVLTTSGWVPYGVIDASTTNVDFFANQPGHMAGDVPGQATAGIVRNALPGLWNGQVGSAGFNRAVGLLTIYGQRTALYLQGNIETGVLLGPAEIPVPSTAWMFGSALAGLAGWRRRRA